MFTYYADDFHCAKCLNSKIFIHGLESFINHHDEIYRAPLLKCGVCGNYIEPWYGDFCTSEIYYSKKPLQLTTITELHEPVYAADGARLLDSNGYRPATTRSCWSLGWF